jgi:hypothetical protein
MKPGSVCRQAYSAVTLRLPETRNPNREAGVGAEIDVRDLAAITRRDGP